MNNGKFPGFKILDCTIRDGGYVNVWRFDKKLVREVYRALSKSGVDYVEIGFRGNTKYFDESKFGIWRFSRDEDIREVTANINGAKIAIMADYGKIDIDDFCDAKESLIELVRVAVHKDKVKEALMLLEKIKQKGYKVSLNAMGYDNYTEPERQALADMVKTSGLDYVYIADSYGSMFPDQIERLLGPLLSLSTVMVGFHPHNNLQMAFANTLEAIRCGAHIIDSTIFGMGRAAGNLPTEIIISFLEREKLGRYNSVPILNIIDRYFVALQKETAWGYGLPYMLSGMFQCHPNYAMALIESKEYTIEDIRKAMEYIRKENQVGFSKQLVDNIVMEGLIGNLGEARTDKPSTLMVKADDAQIQPVKESRNVPYLDRHKDLDFLVLANGPSLKDYHEKICAFISKYDPIILGANYLGELFVPHYHAFTNKRRFVEYIDAVSPDSKLLIGQLIPDALVREYTMRDYENIIYMDRLNHDFGIVEGVIQANCRTVSVLLLAVAIVMGARRIFCAGMDGYMGKDTVNAIHFYNEKDEKEDKEMIIERHRWCQVFIEQIDEYLNSAGKEGVHILTPTSYKSFYKGIDNYI